METILLYSPKLNLSNGKTDVIIVIKDEREVLI